MKVYIGVTNDGSIHIVDDVDVLSPDLIYFREIDFRHYRVDHHSTVNIQLNGWYREFYLQDGKSV